MHYQPIFSDHTAFHFQQIWFTYLPHLLPLLFPPPSPRRIYIFSDLQIKINKLFRTLNKNICNMTRHIHIEVPTPEISPDYNRMRTCLPTFKHLFPNKWEVFVVNDHSKWLESSSLLSVLSATFSRTVFLFHLRQQFVVHSIVFVHKRGTPPLVNTT